MECPESGIYYDVPFAEYLAWPALSKGLLREIRRSPGHLAYRRARPIEATPAMIFGSAVDCLVFDGRAEFDRRYCIKPDGLKLSTKAGIAWKTEHEGKEVVPADVLNCANAIFDCYHAAELVREGESQVSIIWEDQETGILCKGRPDIVDGDGLVVADLKTTQGDVDAETFARTAHGNGYHHLVWYLDGLTAITGMDWNDLQFIAAEQKPPHRVEVYRLGMAELELGREENRAMLELYARCQESDWWPTSTGRVHDLHFPGYAFK